MDQDNPDQEGRNSDHGNWHQPGSNHSQYPTSSTNPLTGGQGSAYGQEHGLHDMPQHQFGALDGFQQAVEQGFRFQQVPPSNQPIMQAPHTTFSAHHDYSEAASAGGSMQYQSSDAHIMMPLDPNSVRGVVHSAFPVQMLLDRGQAVSSTVPMRFSLTAPGNSNHNQVPMRPRNTLPHSSLLRVAESIASTSSTMPASPMPSTSQMVMSSGSSASQMGITAGPSTSQMGITPGPSTSQVGMSSGPSNSQLGMSSTSELGMSPMPSTSHINSIQQFVSQAEAGTSEASPLMVESGADQDSEQDVSSINMVFSLNRPPAPVARLDSYSNEPDTTQIDSTEDIVRHTPVHSIQDYSEAEASSVISHSIPAHHINSLDSTVQLPTTNSALDGSEVCQIAPPTEAHLPEPENNGDIDTSGIADESGIADDSINSDQDEDVDQEPNIMNGNDGEEEEQEGMDEMETHEDVEEGMQNGEPVAGPSSRSERHNVELRKSNRIANKGPQAKPAYVPKPYNPQELWCEDCMTSYSSECTTHRLQVIFDKVVLSRAWSSLPNALQIFRIGESSELGVFAKRTISKNTMFGPFVSEVVDSVPLEQVKNKAFLLKIEKEDGSIVYLNPTDENKCNWMMFVRPAKNYSEQNCVVYQYGADIYFSTIREIENKEELKVWYAAHYAERIGVDLYPVNPTEEAIEEEEEEGQFPCYECNRSFKTSAQLHRHLLIHEDPFSKDDEDYKVEEGPKKRHRRKGIPVRAEGSLTASGKRRGRPPKVQQEVNQDEPNVFQSWKKKKTSIYLNRLKQNTSGASASVKRSIKSLYKKKGKSSGESEWVCTHCDLTFEDLNLLNLHTLTHAAEDVGLEENVEDPTVSQPKSATPDTNQDVSNILVGVTLECPLCKMSFTDKNDLIQHVSSHAKNRRRTINPEKPFKCYHCWKSFAVKEKLDKHMLCHGSDDTKPLQCEVCFKRFMNNSALACHLKIHSDKKYYECRICLETFDIIGALREHAQTHCVNGIYTCPDCGKQFDEWNMIRKHMRAFHAQKKFTCTECGKDFPRPDKLKLHMLRHSNIREFMCEKCGQQFKRLDKLKEHVKRIHTSERESKVLSMAPKPSPAKKFIPKVSPNEYHRFIYKCHICMIGFKRRGILVNHLAKRHPDIKPETVPELNLPILKTQKDYYCQYCDKVYKSSSKRKVHILKNHPGAELPASGRAKAELEAQGLRNFPDPTFSQFIGSVTTVPHPCEFCHKQYASKAKLLQHQRKKHPKDAPPVERTTRNVNIPERNKPQVIEILGVQTLPAAQQIQEQPQGQSIPEQIQATDLLTQAMSELTQSLNADYRQQGTSEYHIIPRIAQNAGGTTTLIQAVQPGQQTTIDMSTLGQIAQAHFQSQQGQSVVTAQQLSPSQIQIVASSQAQGNGAVTHTYIPTTWAATYPNITFR